MFKVFEIIAAITCLWWFGFIFIAGDPNVRIERTCDPVSSVFGRLAGSVVDLAHADNSEDVREWFQEASYSCRYMVWNQFFGDDWRKNQHDAPVTVGGVDANGKPLPVRLGIDGLPLPSLPGQTEPVAGAAPIPAAPLPHGVVGPPVKEEPSIREPRNVAPPTSTKRRTDSLDDIQLPAKLPPGVPSTHP